MDQLTLPNSQIEIDPAEFAEFLAFKEFQKAKESGICYNLTNSPLIVHNPNCHDKQSDQSEEGLCMSGNVRGEGKCLNCGGKWIDTGRGLGCPTCFTMPKKFCVDFHWHGKRCRLYKDQQGNALDSYARAKRLLEKIRGEIDAKTLDITFYAKVDKVKFQFNKYCWNWYELTKDTVAHATLVNRKDFIKNHYIPFFGDQDIREIRSGKIVAFHKALIDKKLSSKFIVTIMVSLHKIFRDAYSWEDIPKLPVFPKTTGDSKPFQWIDRETQQAVLSVIKEHNRPIFQFLFSSGARISEITALQWDCINLKDNVILIKRTHSKGVLREVTKTNNWRLLPLVDELREIIEAQRQKSPAINGYVFRNKDGKVYQYAHLWQIWTRACRKKGIDITPYNATRHSFGSQRINAGFSRDEIGAVMGHCHTDTTKKYSRILTENLKAVLEGKKVVKIKPSVKNRR